MTAPDIAALPQALRDRLDAARERLDVTIDRVETGDRRSHGRAFAFWEVMAGPIGWRDRPPLDLSPGVRPGTPESAGRGPCTVEATDLAVAVTGCLDMADRMWPV